MAYTYRYHGNTGPTRLNRTSWGPMTAPSQIEMPGKIYNRPMSGNFDRIINSFDRTNAFECVRSAFEQASKKEAANHVIQNGGAKTAVASDDSCQKVASFKIENSLVSRFEKQIEENEKKDRFIGHCDIIVNGKTPTSDNPNSRFNRADVGLASRQTPCSDDEVSDYYQDRLYMSQARQLFPLQEDLADWINKTIGITYLTGENFLEVLDNGVELCQLATVIRDKAKEAADLGLYTGVVPQVRGRCWQRAARRSFFSRDNMENFITFCRQLGVHENLLFESDDLVLHAQPRNVILCLLEVARIATKFRVEPPGLVQLEREIALEEAGEGSQTAGRLAATLAWQFQQDDSIPIDDSERKQNPPPSPAETEVLIPAQLFNAESDDAPSIHTDDTWSRGTPEDPDSIPLKLQSELDKRVQIVTRLMQRNCNCSEGRCSKLLKVKKVGEGRYNIAGRNVFIRLLKGRHMMVRVGGGWDTLEHFLTRHDPCQVRVISPHPSNNIQTVTTVHLQHRSPSNASSASSINNENHNAPSRNSDSSNYGDISPAELAMSIIESISDTSSNESKTSARKTSNRLSAVSKSSSRSSINSGRSTSSGKIQPNTKVPSVNGNKSKLDDVNAKVPSMNEVKSKVDDVAGRRKMSPSNLKLDLSLPLNKNTTSLKSSGVVLNNRMVSPVESSNGKMIPPKRVLRTPTNEGRKSLPSPVNVTDNTTRRRSLNLSLPSNSPVKPPFSTSRSQSSIKSPIGYKAFSPVSTKSLVSPKSPVSSSSIEKSVQMALSGQPESPNKPFLHIRAKYRSPPPRDVPPR